MYNIIKDGASKISFLLGRNPKIAAEPSVGHRRFIPHSYSAVIIIAADLELAWAWRYAKALPDPKKEAVVRARTARLNIPKILVLCEKYNIPITWATVGHLFLEECDRKHGVPHSHLERITRHDNPYWRFDAGDWFDDDPCTDRQRSPEWYASDLIMKITESRVDHEIACHTFSHIDCRDGVCTPEVFTSEVNESQGRARKYGLQLESFVHPGNLIGNLDTLSRLGFKSFRSDYENTLGFPSKHANGLWEFKSTMELTLRKGWSIKYHIYYYNTIVNEALRRNRVCYFWFHPSMHPLFIDKVFRAVLEFVDSKRRKLWITTTSDYVDWLEHAK